MSANDSSILPAPRLARAGIPGLLPWVAPGSGTELLLSKIFATALGLDRVGATDDFFALGGTSLQAAAIFAAIEAEFRQRLPLATLYRSPDVRSLAAVIDRAANGNGEQCAASAPSGSGGVVLIKAGSGGAPLFIAPGVGGDVVGLAHLARALDPAQAVYGLRSAGLLPGEEPVNDMREIATRFVSGIRQVAPAGPYQLFGACWGALVMIEAAAQIRACGDEVRLLALLDPPPLEAMGNGAAGHVGNGSRHTAPSLRRFVTARFGLYRRALHDRSVTQWPAYIGGRLANLFDALRRHDLLRGDPTEYLRWRVEEANRQAMRGYRPSPCPGAACLIFTGERGEGASLAARQWWTHFLRAEGHTLQVHGRDTGDALSPIHAAELAALLAPLLAPR
jgi:thioesterase domain-containing protein/acyl carrier protein